MNVENPYSPFTPNSLSAQLFNFQNLLALMHLTSLPTYLNEPMQPMSSSLNEKRWFSQHKAMEYNDLEFDPGLGRKRIKPDLGFYNRNMYQYKPHTENHLMSQSKYQTNDPNVVPVDDDQDCFIIENSSVENNGWNSLQNTQINSFIVPEQHSQRLKNNQILDSNLRKTDQNQKRINVNQTFISSRISQPVEIIVIDNDDDDEKIDLINTQHSQNNSPRSTSLSEYNSTVHSQSLDGTHPIVHSALNGRATLPPFELSSRSRHRKPRRVIKPVWNPVAFGAQTFQAWLGEIEKIVGMEVTNEEKVIKVMKDFDLNIDIALRTIRRNKAHYKNFFKVQKLEKERAF